MTLQEPDRDGTIALEEVAKHRNDLLDLADSCSPPHTLMTEMRRPDAMFLREEDLWITEASCRKNAGLITGPPQTAQQSGFCASLQGSVDGKASVRFKIPTESSTGQKQRHGWAGVAMSLAGAMA